MAQQEDYKDKDKKTYTFRDIPPAVHLLWKTCSAMREMTMEDFALTAIKEKCAKEMGNVHGQLG